MPLLPHSPTPARLTALALSIAVGTGLSAQYRTAKIPAVGISISISGRLKGLPLRLDSADPYLRARYRTANKKDLVKTKDGKVDWAINVYEFGAQKGPMTPSRKPPKDGQPDEKPSGLAALLAKLRARSTGSGADKSFAAWVKRQRPIETITKAKAMPKKGSKLPYALWEYTTRAGYGGGSSQIYNGAAVYKIQGAEIAVVVSAPMSAGDPPKGKLGAYIRHTLISGRRLKEGDGNIKDNSTRDRYANTPARREALAKAKSNIASLRNWGYFTSANYIVMYSWEKPVLRQKSMNFARRLVTKLERMRKLYMQYYEPRKDTTLPFSVFRVCATYEQFQKYGNSPRGVVGWFSPRSKELVVFQGGDSRMRKKGYVETVTYHEGWHQYCDAFFKGATVHRWFDEGHGDFFGAHVPTSGGFSYVGSPMRYKWVKLMVKKMDYVPFDVIVKWPVSQFYGSPRSAYYYAQAYGMIDFLRRGPKLGKKRFNPRWGEILPTYRRVMLKKGDQRAAVKAAFDGVNFFHLEKAWREWVKSPRFKKPK